MICERIEECLSKEEDSSTIVFKDNSKGASKSEYRIINKDRKKYKRIDFENCVYNDAVKKKCDFGLWIKEESICYIELKGSDVKSGISQLLLTLKDTEECFRGLEKKARLIVTEFSKPRLIKKRPEYVDLMKLTNSNFLIKEKLEERI